MRIGVDVMGGDHAPQVVIDGIVKVLPLLKKEDVLVLFGDQQIIQTSLGHLIDSGRIEVVGTTEVIEMSDHPAKAFKTKSNSSIVVGFTHLAQNNIDAFASAGSTGAMLAGAMFTQKLIANVTRPCIPTFMPMLTGGVGVLVDAGLNSDCKPEMLYQFAILGSVYAQYVLDVKEPRVALLSNGSEREKGNLLVTTAHELILSNANKKLNFVGNIEGNAIFSGKVADVIVCDGFVGNIVLKEAEALYKLVKKQGIDNPFFDRFNYEIYGGTPVLGIESTVIIGHGHSSVEAIKNMILQAEHVATAELSSKIVTAFS